MKKMLFFVAFACMTCFVGAQSLSVTDKDWHWEKGTIVVDESISIPVSDAKSIAEEIESRYEDCDVEYHNGGQPLYYYLISVE